MYKKDKFCLNSILEAIEKIERFSSDFNDADEFYRDERDFDAALMNFIILGEMAQRLSQEFKNRHTHIDWTEIKAFRNLVAHDYFGVDAEEVWQIIKNHLPDLKEKIKAILAMRKEQ